MPITRAGVEAAVRRGKHRGGRAKMSPAQIAEARLLMKGGAMKTTAVAKRYSVGRATLFRNLKRNLLQRIAHVAG